MKHNDLTASATGSLGLAVGNADRARFSSDLRPDRTQDYMRRLDRSAPAFVMK